MEKEDYEKDIKKLKKVLSGMTPEEKDEALASYIAFANENFKKIFKSLKIIKSSIKDALTKKNTIELEQSLSVGPAWLNFSLKKKQKK